MNSQLHTCSLRVRIERVVMKNCSRSCSAVSLSECTPDITYNVVQAPMSEYVSM